MESACSRGFDSRQRPRMPSATNRLPLFASIFGLVLGATAAGYALESGSRPGSASQFPARAYLPQIAKDEALACGEERWSVKTLSDAAAGAVDFTPIGTTVDQLRALPKPAVGQNTPRMAGTESSTFTLTVRLLEMKLEDDRDIHLVVGDLVSGNSMIVEFPDVACEGAIDSARMSEMQSARTALVAACGNAPSSSFKQLSGQATITGVGFFDVIHGQTGVAPNGIELHPVLSLADITC